jgi:hypothetical protein
MNNKRVDNTQAADSNVLYFFVATAFLGLITAVTAMSLYLWL